MSRNWKLTALQGDTEIDTLITQAAANRENLCLQSEVFGTTWSTFNAAVQEANSIAAPDGTTTADKCGDDSSTGTGAVIFFQSVTYQNGVNTASVYAKAGGEDWIRMNILDVTTGGDAYFNVATGTAGTATGLDSSSIEDVGNGWYRCSITWDGTGQGDLAGTVNIYVCDGDLDPTVALDGTSYVYLWGAQVEASTTATAYIPTTTVARTITGRAATNALQDDVHIALETVLEVTNQSTDDLWKRYKRLT